MLTLRSTFGRAQIFSATSKAKTGSWAGGRAGEGNRTLVSSLGSWRSTIELHPRKNLRLSILDRRFASGNSLPRNHVAGTGVSIGGARLLIETGGRGSASERSIFPN